MRYLKSFESFNYSVSPKIWSGINDVIYTCIIGNHDNLLSQPKIKGVDYVCFTDQDLKELSENPDSHVNKICSVQYNVIISDKNGNLV